MCLVAEMFENATVTFLIRIIFVPPKNGKLHFMKPPPLKKRFVDCLIAPLKARIYVTEDNYV